MIARTLFATIALGLALAAPGHAASGKDCGLTSRIDGQRFQIVIQKGSTRTTCTSAKRALSSYLRTFTRPKAWTCFLGHGAQDWAAACSRPSVLVRAYAPA